MIEVVDPHEAHREAALYWSAVSLVVCEGLSVREAAERLGVDGEALRRILRRRRALSPTRMAAPVSPLKPNSLLQ